MGSSYIFWSIAPFALILFLEATKHHIATDRAMVIIGITCSILSFSIGIIATFIELIRYKIKIKDNETSENNQEETEKDKVQNWKIYLFRGLAAFITSVLCNFLASLGLSILSGFMSVFPAMFSVTMISLWISHSSDLPIASAGSLMLGVNSLNIFALTLAWFYLYLQLSLFYAIMIAWIGSILFGSIPMFVFLKWIESKKERMCQTNSKKSQELPSISSHETTL